MFFGYSPLDFQQMKLALIDWSGLAKDALHIYAGLAMFLLVRLLWRWRGGWIVAWIATLAMACAVEYIDLLAEFTNSSVQPDAEHWHDVWNTMFWPTVLLLVGRWLQPRPKPEVTEVASGDLADESLEEASTV